MNPWGTKITGVKKVSLKMVGSLLRGNDFSVYLLRGLAPLM